jgi:uncharacterized membrane protein YfcA
MKTNRRIREEDGIRAWALFEAPALERTIVAVFTGTGVMGGFLGNRLGARVHQDLLKHTFAVFLAG